MKHEHSDFGTLPDEALISTAVICAMTGLSTSAAQVRIYNDPTFPRPIKFSARCTRFRIGEVRTWLKKKAAETEAQLAEKKKQRIHTKQPEAAPKKSKSRTRASA